VIALVVVFLVGLAGWLGLGVVDELDARREEREGLFQDGAVVPPCGEEWAP
jgi:hypothetical protein